MQIHSITLYLLKLPLVRPFETSFGRVSEKRTIITRVRTGEGLDGFGEAAALDAPFYNHETVETCWHVMKDFLAPLLFRAGGEEPIFAANSLFARIKGHRIAKSGLEMALWDLAAKAENIPLSRKLGGIRDKVAVGESIGVKATIQEVLQEVEERLQAGFQRIKVKIKPGWDWEVLNEIRKQFGSIPLMADANASYRLEDFELLKKLDDLDLLMLEQPLDGDDLWDHARLQRIIRTPVCLDESIKSVQDARKALEMGSCKIINIKPGRVGGLLEAQRIHDLCAENNIPVWCGGMLETGVGKSACIALAALPNFLYPADISPSEFFYARDILTETYRVDREGLIKVSKKTGLGAKIDFKFLKKCELARLEIQG